MDLRQLEILQAIAETGSFTACGRKLHVSQSAISRQILLLEEELGEPLFLRVGRQVRMTPAAEKLVQLGQRVFQDVHDTVGAITDRTRELSGTLRLSGGMTEWLGRSNVDYTTPFAIPVPEPSTYAMMAIGLFAIGFATRRARPRS